VARLGPDIDVLEAPREPPPRQVALGAVGWARKHLFSSAFNTALTIITLLIVVLLIRGFAGFVFDNARRWGSVTFNMRLYMVFAYPADHMLRVWLSLAIIMSLFGFTFAAWGGDHRVNIRRATTVLATVGAALGVFAVVAGPIPLVWGDPPISLRAEIVLLIVAGVIAGAVRLIRLRWASDEDATISRGVLIAIWAAIGAVLIWLLRVPTPMYDETGTYHEPLRPLATSTTVPLTIMLAILVVSFFLGRAVVRRWGEGRLRNILIALWVLSYPTIIFVILRAPDVDWQRVWNHDIWIIAGFIVAGGLLTWFVADPARRQRGRTLGIIVAVVAVAMFWPLGIGGLARNLMVITAIFAILAPSFSGEGSTWRIVVTYAAVIAIAAFFMIMMDTTMSFTVSKRSFLGGLVLTITLAVGALALGFPLAILVALGRQSKMPIFRQLSIGYIELVRGVPTIVWLIMGISLFGFFVPKNVSMDAIVRVLAAFTIFWAAYLAENIRGGLQAISKGQTEAAYALGMTTFQTTALIVLPQALRLVIPPIVGQVITAFKDTSLVAIVGVFELLNVARAVPQQTDPFKFLGTAPENLLFVALVYFVFTAAISQSSLRLESKLGVGER